MTAKKNKAPVAAGDGDGGQGQLLVKSPQEEFEEQFAKMHYSVRVITAAYQFSPPRSTPS